VRDTAQEDNHCGNHTPSGPKKNGAVSSPDDKIEPELNLTRGKTRSNEKEGKDGRGCMAKQK